ncbi:phosphatidylinositol glycan anchor biosynthesis class M [Lycorma delicatula]|uniref:phosphatidylinositol glycan anchor biosynthesis class M n=1 Tax=Lycorma delicatula TaxID=130591 RepID=UPI003F5186A0
MISSFGFHYKIGFLLRTFMIIFSSIQDEISEVKYTDVDYKVFTDAAFYVINGDSPYKRKTYRYSPLLAYILTPNIFIHHTWGKFLFSLCDIILCIFIERLLTFDKIDKNTKLWCVFFWLYNPMTIIISTRGNADSLSSLFVLSTLLAMKSEYHLLAGFLHGMSIHFRIYPIIFSLCMYLSIPNDNKSSIRSCSMFYKKIIINLLPNRARFKLVFACVFTLILITWFYYSCYGYTFLNESFLYHIKRKDVRHNFSVFFYLQYLSSVVDIPFLQRLLIVLPQIILLSVVSFVYGSANHINFCHLLLAFIMVTYNTVLTCQYFIWFLSIVPVVIPHLKFSLKESILLVLLWVTAQIAWLLPAYLLEFKNKNTFIYIWCQGLIFFCVNIYIITRLIKNYHKVKLQTINQKTFVIKND